MALATPTSENPGGTVLRQPLGRTLVALLLLAGLTVGFRLEAGGEKLATLTRKEDGESSRNLAIWAAKKASGGTANLATWTGKETREVPGNLATWTGKETREVPGNLATWTGKETRQLHGFLATWAARMQTGRGPLSWIFGSEKRRKRDMGAWLLGSGRRPTEGPGTRLIGKEANEGPGHPEMFWIQMALRALETATKFFENNYDRIILDGIFGLRIAEGKFVFAHVWVFFIFKNLVIVCLLVLKKGTFQSLKISLPQF